MPARFFGKAFLEGCGGAADFRERQVQILQAFPQGLGFFFAERGFLFERIAKRGQYFIELPKLLPEIACFEKRVGRAERFENAPVEGSGVNIFRSGGELVRPGAEDAYFFRQIVKIFGFDKMVCVVYELGCGSEIGGNFGILGSRRIEHVYCLPGREIKADAQAVCEKGRHAELSAEPLANERVQLVAKRLCFASVVFKHGRFDIVADTNRDKLANAKGAFPQNASFIIEKKQLAPFRTN